MSPPLSGKSSEEHACERLAQKLIDVLGSASKYAAHHGCAIGHVGEHAKRQAREVSSSQNT